MPVAEADSAPLSDAELTALFAPLEDVSAIALAVSGGADSFGLLAAIDRWLKLGRDRPKVIVLTVDHRLRPESAGEAAMVAREAKMRGMAVKTLVWRGPHPASGVEAAARAARYRLLLDATSSFGARHLLVAHHRDDQAETHLIRLSRGSGIFGLAAMRPTVVAGDVTIVRPFLDVPRERLRATAVAAGLEPVDDPMNHDDRFLRVRIRDLMPTLAARGIGPATLAARARRFAVLADELEARTDAAIEVFVRTSALGFVTVGPDWRMAPPDVRSRMLTRILLAIGGNAYPPRGERLAALAAAMAEHRGGRFKRTLAGAVIEGRAGEFAVYREIGRESPAEMTLERGLKCIFDHRFAVEATGAVPGRLRLGILGENDRLALKLRPEGVPAGAVVALPALRLAGKVVAVPPLGWGTRFDLSLTPIVARRITEPRRFPDFHAAA